MDGVKSPLLPPTGARGTLARKLRTIADGVAIIIGIETAGTIREAADELAALESAPPTPDWYHIVPIKRIHHPGGATEIPQCMEGACMREAKWCLNGEAMCRQHFEDALITAWVDSLPAAPAADAAPVEDK